MSFPSSLRRNYCIRREEGGEKIGFFPSFCSFLHPSWVFPTNNRSHKFTFSSMLGFFSRVLHKNQCDDVLKLGLVQPLTCTFIRQKVKARKKGERDRCKKRESEQTFLYCLCQDPLLVSCRHLSLSLFSSERLPTVTDAVIRTEDSHIKERVRDPESKPEEVWRKRERERVEG